MFAVALTLPGIGEDPSPGWTPPASDIQEQACCFSTLGLLQRLAFALLVTQFWGGTAAAGRTMEHQHHHGQSWQKKAWQQSMAQQLSAETVSAEKLRNSCLEKIVDGCAVQGERLY